MENHNPLMMEETNETAEMHKFTSKDTVTMKKK